MRFKLACHDTAAEPPAEEPHMATQARPIEHGAAPALPRTPVKALAMLGIVILAVAAFIGISTALGLVSVYGGFLFVFYFAGLCHAAPDAFIPAAVGAFCGLGIAALLTVLPATMGIAGMAVALGVVLVAVYALLLGRAGLLVNNATMLFLTVGTIPALNTTAMLAEMALSLLLAVVLLGAALLVGRMRAR